ncbi:MAG: hypothetical protein OEU95_01690 [Nitrospirota bacterium]|nr:hypothetical protein [Nitrospirota bacterium]
MMKLISVITIVLVFSFIASGSVDAATTVFEENFESYAQTSNLSGQGGWSGDVIYIGNGGGLGTNVVSAQIRGNGESWSKNTFETSLSSTNVYTLTFDAFAYSNFSHDSGIFFGESGNYNSWSVGWYSNWGRGWYFDARGITDSDFNAEKNREYFAGGTGHPVNFSVVLDPVVGEVYGFADFGSGLFETTHYGITSSQFSTVDGVQILQDYRNNYGSGGGEFDNIRVTASPVAPEPISSILFVTGGTLLAGRRCLRKRK